MAYCLSGENKIFYQTWGEENNSAAWITLINGHMRTSRDFMLLAKHLVNQGLRVIAFDNRGSGQTEILQTSTFSLQDCARDCMAIWEELGVCNSHLLGISMGGVIAQILLRAKTSVLDGQKVCLISTAGDLQYLRLREADWPEDLAAIEERLGHYFSAGFLEKNKLLLQAMAKNFQKEITSSNFNERAKAQKSALARLEGREIFTPGVLNEMLILHGGVDTIVPVEAASHMKDLYINSEVRIYPKCGHLLIPELGMALYQEIGDWIIKA